jgi:hypothetical protein
MASTSETGHAKNVANFEDMISFCIGYGATYNPSKISIQIASLQGLRTTAQNSLQNFTGSNTVFINAVNARQIVFNPIKPLATRIVNALAATDATPALISDAKTINRKIQGGRKGGNNTPPVPPRPADTNPPVPPVPPVPPIPPTPIPTPGDPTPGGNQISVSQQSYDSLIENFGRLIQLVASEPSYTPNETDLQVATLTAQLADLSTKNTAVIDANTNVSNSRIARNQILYTDKTGLYDIAQEVKKYVKSVFGASSPQYKQVSKIKFTKPRT